MAFLCCANLVIFYACPYNQYLHTSYYHISAGCMLSLRRRRVSERTFSCTASTSNSVSPDSTSCFVLLAHLSVAHKLVPGSPALPINATASRTSYPRFSRHWAARIADGGAWNILPTLAVIILYRRPSGLIRFCSISYMCSIVHGHGIFNLSVNGLRIPAKTLSVWKWGSCHPRSSGWIKHTSYSDNPPRYSPHK